MRNLNRGGTSWQRHETDCSITQASWVQKRFRDPDANNGCERVHFTNGPGTKVYFVAQGLSCVCDLRTQSIGAN